MPQPFDRSKKHQQLEAFYLGTAAPWVRNQESRIQSISCLFLQDIQQQQAVFLWVSFYFWNHSMFSGILQHMWLGCWHPNFSNRSQLISVIAKYFDYFCICYVSRAPKCFYPYFLVFDLEFWKWTLGYMKKLWDDLPFPNVINYNGNYWTISINLSLLMNDSWCSLPTDYPKCNSDNEKANMTSFLILILSKYLIQLFFR